ncbi:MAG: FAD/NAD(P)-binding oxidoreductase [Verrucomicrobia bacterium]|nr:FAD/NAD(P)-binding oxidoreductase [Verrucomicrobiota bacterium]
MIQRDYLIVGAGIGGATVCESLREYDPKGSVTLVGYESALPYHRSRLFSSVLAKGDPKALSNIYCHPPEWYVKNKIELRLETLVTQFNIGRRIAVLNTGQVIEFRKCCLAMGSRVRRPQVAGANLGKILYLRSLRDLLALKEMIVGEKNIFIIGGGFIAAEAAAALRTLGLKVTLLCSQPALWQQWLDPETARWLTEFFAAKGVPLLHATLNGFEGKTVLRNIQTKSGDRIAAELAIVAGGVEPNLGLVANTPLGSPNGTPVNDYLETDEKGIFAVGDIALYPDAIFGGVRRSEHCEITLEQARVAGANLTGKKRQRFKALPHNSCTVFNLRFDFVGDFSQAPVRYEIQGDRDKPPFTARYFQGPKLMGMLLCNSSPEAVENAKAEVILAHKH